MTNEAEVLKKFMNEYRAVVRRKWQMALEAYMRIPEPIRAAALEMAREKKYRDAHEAERQAGLAYVRELGAQARRDLGLPEEER